VPAYSSVFRSPWSASVAALAAVPLAKDGSRKIRYVNPLSGGAVMLLVDCYRSRIEAGATIPYRSTSNAVGVVVEGTGTSHVGNEASPASRRIFSASHTLSADNIWFTSTCDKHPIPCLRQHEHKPARAVPLHQFTRSPVTTYQNELLRRLCL
jgi:hypothetical protein